MFNLIKNLFAKKDGKESKGCCDGLDLGEFIDIDIEIDHVETVVSVLETIDSLGLDGNLAKMRKQELIDLIEKIKGAVAPLRVI
jgi:hypothetical protein